ncbi:MAG: DUF192 domain-containing protein [Patescibacteria group bacterium]|nr:DUF192 domain-containing protein [Patescibacteria group bacterium]
MKILIVLVTIILVGFGTALFLIQKDYREKKTIGLSIVGRYNDKKKVSFSVEVADDAAKRAKGLMFRDKLPKDEGMIFVFQDQKDRVFWMKNTKISLDMIFINRDGEIVGLLKSTRPESARPLSVGADSSYVLEINAGLVDKYDIKEGDLIKGLEKIYPL